MAEYNIFFFLLNCLGSLCQTEKLREVSESLSFSQRHTATEKTDYFSSLWHWHHPKASDKIEVCRDIQATSFDSRSTTTTLAQHSACTSTPCFSCPVWFRNSLVIPVWHCFMMPFVFSSTPFRGFHWIS